MPTYPEFLIGDRLSPLPEDRANTVRLDTRPDFKQLQSWDKESVKKLGKLVSNPKVLKNYSLAKHRAYFKANGAPGTDDPGFRRGPKVTVPRTESAVVVDEDGFVLALVIRGFVKGSSRTNIDVSVNANMPHEFKKRHPNAPTPSTATTPQHDTISKATAAAAAAASAAALPSDFPSHDSVDGSATATSTTSSAVIAADHQRHENDWYLTESTEHPWGDWHFVLAWHAKGHQWSDTYGPNRELLGHRSTRELVRRYLFLDSFYALNHRVNHLLYTVHPAFSRILRAARPLLADHPVIQTLLPIWHSDFPGYAILMNKQSGEHLDVSGVHHGCDVIVVTGDFGRGELYLRDLNLVLALEPGDLVLFDGTLQRHCILPFDGPQRVSHVFFVHQSILTELGLDTANLQDPTLQGIRRQLRAYPAERRARAEAARLARLEVKSRPTRSRRGGQNNKKKPMPAPTSS